MELNIGCDPELFLFDKQGNPVSGFGIIRGTKDAPFAVKNGAVQVDGTALEFNTDPAKTEEEFIGNVNSVLDQLRAMVPEGLELKSKAAIFYDGTYFRELPDEAKELGCDPDFDAYDLIENVMDNEDGGEKILRTASGHVHVGWTEDADKMSERHFNASARMARELDIWLGLWSLAKEGQDGRQRRKLYGRAGAFRPKTYGMEYRTLSNFWVGDGELTKQVYRRTKKAFNCMVEQRLKQEMVDPNRVRSLINCGDKHEAQYVLKDIGVPIDDL